MKINLFKTKKNFRRKNLDLNPRLYWKIIVGVASVLVLLSFVFGYYIFNQIKIESETSAENLIRKQPINQERLEKTLEYFSERENKSAEVLNSPAPVVDPSI